MFNKTEFLNQFNSILSEEYGIPAKEATPQQIHFAVSCAVMRSISDNWAKSREAHLNSRRACYFSMEFLVGPPVNISLDAV